MKEEILKNTDEVISIIDKAENRLNMMKNKTINVKIAVANQEWETMNVVATSYTEDILELKKMIEEIKDITIKSKELSYE